MSKDQSRRRWFQVSLAEWLILTTLLGLALWQCVRPVEGVRTVIPTASPSNPNPRSTPPENWRITHETPNGQAMERPPTLSETTFRLVLSSAFIGIWLVGSIAVRAIIRRRSEPHS